MCCFFLPFFGFTFYSFSPLDFGFSVHIWLISFASIDEPEWGRWFTSGKQKQSDRNRLQKLRNDEGQDGKVTVWADECVCVCVLINTTMKVGCAEASGTLGQGLWATDRCYVPIHTTSVIQCLMYLENYLHELAELWSKKTKKSIKCAYLAKGFFKWIIYLSHRGLSVMLESGRVWICGACFQPEQPASQSDHLWPVNAPSFSEEVKAGR